MINIMNKIRDVVDREVSLVVILDDMEQLNLMTTAIVCACKGQFVYKPYFNENETNMLELRMPNNRVSAVMRYLSLNKWTLRPISPTNVLFRMEKL